MADHGNDIRPLHCGIPMTKSGWDRGLQQWMCKACKKRTVKPWGEKRLTREEMNRRYYLKKKKKEGGEG